MAILSMFYGLIISSYYADGFTARKRIDGELGTCYKRKNIYKIEPLRQLMMNSRVKDVKAAENYTLHLWFDNGEQGIFDMKPYLDEGIFRALRDIEMFNSVKPFIGSVQWVNEADICPDTLYLDSVKI